ncbi:Uncharacterised protein [Mycobacteroides abscessus subsp. abscessus]|nr:Uncharacterised protein [Mycobacteroides abscessus subsp. abscessus]
MYFDSRKLDDRVINSGKPCCFDVKDDIRTFCQRDRGRIIGNRNAVINQIDFDSVKDFNIIFLSGTKCLRE